MFPGQFDVDVVYLKFFFYGYQHKISSTSDTHGGLDFTYRSGDEKSVLKNTSLFGTAV